MKVHLLCVDFVQNTLSDCYTNLQLAGKMNNECASTECEEFVYQI